MIDNSDNPSCEECGCKGNRECGCLPVNENWGCALGDDLVCKCCEELGVEENKKRWHPENKKDAEKIELFNN